MGPSQGWTLSSMWTGKSGENWRRPLPKKSDVIHFVTTMLAVFLAVFVEGLLQDNNLQKLANRARRAVETEIGQNAREFADSAPYLRALRCQLEMIVKAKGHVEPDAVNDLAAVFPDVSTAAWQAAQMSAAGRYVDYEMWMLQVAQAYLLYDEYANARRGFFDHFARLTAWVVENGGVAGEPDELAHLARPVYGHLRILEVLHFQVQARLSAPVGSSNEPRRLQPCSGAGVGGVN